MGFKQILCEDGGSKRLLRVSQVGSLLITVKTTKFFIILPMFLSSTLRPCKVD